MLYAKKINLGQERLYLMFNSGGINDAGTFPYSKMRNFPDCLGRFRNFEI